MSKKRKKLHGRVNKVIKSAHGSSPEKVQININEADPLYRELRVENVLSDENGMKEALRPGAEVDVVIEADSGATVRKPE